MRRAASHRGVDLTRRGVLGRVGAGWARASRAAAGKAALQSWGYGDNDVEEITETLASMVRQRPH